MSATRPPAVWVVSELYWPEDTSTGHFLTGIAEAVARTRPTHALCAQPTYRARGTIAPARETRHGVDVRRVRSTLFDKDSVALRLVNMVTITASVFLAALRGVRRGDAVLVVTNPPALPFAAALACRLRGARLLLLVHDVYPDVLVATGFSPPGSLLTRAVGAAARWLYARAERVIVLGRDMEALARRKVPGHRGVVVVPNWGDVDEIRPMPRERNALLARLGLGDRFVVQYMGNMGRSHGIDTVAEAAERLRDDAGLHVLFIGGGNRKAWLERRVAERELANVSVLGSRPRGELCDALNACDVSVIAFLPGMAGVSVPSRMYNVMAAGKPIIAVADPESELARVVTEEGIGWVVPPAHPELLVDAVREARRDPARLAAMGRRARAAAEAKYSRAAVAGLYEELLDDVLGSRSTPAAAPVPVGAGR